MNEPLWILGDLAAACDGQLRGVAAETPVGGTSIDTRTLAPGDAFFAIRGVRMDAHQFVPRALDLGAAAAVISEGDAEPAIVVDDVLVALARVGMAARARLDEAAPVVAVTGSVGKTGTKELLQLAFGKGCHASAASYNNHWGVPLSLSRMPKHATAAIFEIGMNHAGEIRPLAKLVRPHIAIVTTVAPVHLEFFDSVAGIADAKAEIFEGLAPGGTAVIPSDNEHTARLTRAAEAAGANVVTFGEGGDVRVAAREGNRILAAVPGEEVGYALADPADHVVANSLAVLAALWAAGRDLRGMAALGDWSPSRGRGRQVRLRPAGGEALLLDEAFNANPASMAAAIATLGRVPAGRRIAILGDMLELGPTAPDLHRGLVPLLVDAGARIVHTVGRMSEHLRDALPYEMRGEHAATAAELALPQLVPDDVVLVKGSKAIGLTAVAEAIEARYGLEGGDV